MKSFTLTIIFALQIMSVYAQSPTPDFATERLNRQNQIKTTQEKMRKSPCYNNFLSKICTPQLRKEYDLLEEQLKTLNTELEKTNQSEGLAQKEAYDRTPQGFFTNLGAYILIGLVSFLPIAGIGLVIWLALRRKPSTSYGSAESASFTEISNKLIVKDTFETNGAELVLGYVNGKFIALPGDTSICHVLVLGPTKAGKSYTLYLPNIAVANNVSYFINDIKGEIWEKVSGYFPNVYRFAPMEPEMSEKFNWIPYLRDDAARALTMAEAMLSVNTLAGQKDHWEGSGINLLAALWLHVAETDDPTPGRADDILRGSFENLKNTLANSPSATAKKLASTVVDGNEKEAKGIVSTLANKTTLFLDNKVRAFTDTPRMTDWRELRRTPTQIYWCVPETRMEVLKPLTALALSLAFEQLKEIKGITTLMMLDELANIGKIPKFTTELTLVRGRGIGIIAALQSYGQLEEIYGHAAAKTLKDNFQTKVIFRGLSYQTTEEISRELGEYTHQERVDERTQMHARRLMTAEEISNMPNDNILIKVTGVNPFLAAKVTYDLPDQNASTKPIKNVTPQHSIENPKQIEPPKKELPSRMPPRPPKSYF